MRSAAHLTNYQFHPGQSGNPSGHPKNPISRKALSPYQQDILDALLAALKNPEERIEALKIATVYLWGKPVEFETSETEGVVREMNTALSVVDSMSVEECKRLVRGEAGLPAVENGSIEGVKPKVKA